MVMLPRTTEEGNPPRLPLPYGEITPNAAAILRGCSCGSAQCACARGRRRTHCPAAGHADRNPSLDVDERAGRVMVICRASCGQDDVIEGLRRRGLWSSPAATQEQPRPGESPRDVARRQILAAARRQPWAREDIALTYVISDAIRRRRRAVDLARDAATRAGDRPESWELLQRAAHMDSEADALEAELEGALACSTRR